jgi:hypothetical protein
MIVPGTTIDLRRSPDLQAILEYLDEVVERAHVCNRLEDPDLRRLFGRLATLKPGEIFEHEILGRTTMVLEPGDRLLDVVAKMRATERLIYAQR